MEVAEGGGTVEGELAIDKAIVLDVVEKVVGDNVYAILDISAPAKSIEKVK